jgi:hypothetical protein
VGKQVNAQREMTLLAEWLGTLPATWKSKTHVNAGAQVLQYHGQALTPAQQKAFGVWNDWVDARVYTGSEVWIVEAKIVATGAAYGQLLDYLNQYRSSADYQKFAPAPIVGVVVCQAARGATTNLFAQYGIRTIIFSPSFSLASGLMKLFPAAQILEPTSNGETIA